MDKFDAIIIHIRGLPNDWPEKRSEKQREELNGTFNKLYPVTKGLVKFVLAVP